MNAVMEKEAVYSTSIDDECTIYAQGRDPVTGDPLFNAKAIAAMKEARAIMRGEIPAKRYKPHEFEQAIKDLLED